MRVTAPGKIQIESYADDLGLEIRRAGWWQGDCRAVIRMNGMGWHGFEILSIANGASVVTGREVFRRPLQLKDWLGKWIADVRIEESRDG